MTYETDKHNTSATNAFNTGTMLALPSIRTPATLALAPGKDCSMCLTVIPPPWRETRLATNLILQCYGQIGAMQAHVFQLACGPSATCAEGHSPLAGQPHSRYGTPGPVSRTASNEDIFRRIGCMGTGHPNDAVRQGARNDRTEERERRSMADGE